MSSIAAGGTVVEFDLAGKNYLTAEVSALLKPEPRIRPLHPTVMKAWNIDEQDVQLHSLYRIYTTATDINYNTKTVAFDLIGDEKKKVILPPDLYEGIDGRDCVSKVKNLIVVVEKLLRKYTEIKVLFGLN
eukprot:204970_1